MDRSRSARRRAAVTMRRSVLGSLVAIGGVLLMTDAAVAQRSFSADAAVADGSDFGVTATAGSVNVAVEELLSIQDSGDESTDGLAPGEASREVTTGPPDVELMRQELIPVGTMPRSCDCLTATTVKTDDIRDISDQWASDGNAINTYGASNMVWGFGQFLDHDLALTIEDEQGATINVDSANPSDPMEVHRAVTTSRSGCKATLNVHTPQIDAGPIYGTDEAYLQSTLREPGTCFLRTSEGRFLPVTTKADSKGRFLFVAGDVRVSEHAFLAVQHTVWLREHNRLCNEVDNDPTYANTSPDGKFELVKAIIIAKLQQVVLEEFLPALGITESDLKALNSGSRSMNRPDVSVEFSIAYRLGHDLIGNTVGGIQIEPAFDSESFFLDVAGTSDAPSITIKDNADSNIDSIMRALSTTPCSEFDGKLSDALRNFLFGKSEGEDLAGRNIFRGRELGVPTYGGLAECFGLTPDAATESETPDAWLGLLREPKAPGSPLGPTLRAILVDQFHRSFFGPGGFYWKKSVDDVGAYVNEIESSTYAKIISANTGAGVSGNVFRA